MAKINRFFLLFFCVLLAVTQSKPNFKQLEDVFEDIYDNSDSYTALPISYYSAGELTLSTDPGAITYVQLIQCDNSTAGLPYIMIDIILPSNVNFTNDSPFALLEISSCADEWTSDCIVATNYLYTDMILQAYNTVTIPYNESASTLYLRMKAEIAQASVSIHVSYVNETHKPFYGEFVSAIFNNIEQGSDWNYLYQLAKTDQINNVPSTKSVFYYVNFCTAAIITDDYTVTVTVNGLPSTPLAGFDLAACAAASIPLSKCLVTKASSNGFVVTQSAAFATSVELYSGDFSLGAGIYINVFGYGGELDGSNEFILSVIETPGHK